MKLKKVLKRLREFLSADERKRVKHMSSLKRLLKALKGKQRKLERAAENASSARQRKDIKSKLKVIYRQREKGVQALRKATRKEQ